MLAFLGTEYTYHCIHQMLEITSALLNTISRQY